jgi:predicted dehydrogenase
MTASELRIGIAGCGVAARIHLERLLAEPGLALVGIADPELDEARSLSDWTLTHTRFPSGTSVVPVYADHRELLRAGTPDALAIFAPHLMHYRLAMDALQAGCHVFIEKPFSTNVQEAADIVSLAKARGLKVAVGHQFRLCASLIEARRRLASGSIGPLRLVTAVLSRPWLSTLERGESNWRFHPQVAGNGILADAGDHLIDALLWTTGKVALEVGAVQARQDPGIDLVTAAAIRLADGTPATVAISGVSPGSRFVLEYFGELGHLRATDQALEEERSDTARREIPLHQYHSSIDGNFVAALRTGSPLCCPAEEALDTVRLLEAIARSAATGQIVRLR